MTDEQIWLLQFGRRWVDWWELEDVSGNDTIALYERLIDAGRIESNAHTMRLRLKPKEKNESIRV